MTAAFLMLIATLGSCVKGDKGDTGAPGANGTNGTNGNANVVSGSIAINPSNWAWDASNLWYACDITDSAINADIVSSGSVLAFIQIQPYINWYALPYSFATSSSVSIYYGYNYFLYNLHLTFQFSNQDMASSIATYYCKVVCITSSQRKSHPHTNWNDYNEVMQVVNESPIKTN